MPWASGWRLEVNLVTLEVRDHPLDRLNAHDLAAGKLRRTTRTDERPASAVLAPVLESTLRDGGDLDGGAELKAHRALVTQEAPVHLGVFTLQIVALPLADERH
jgi:hypothetical protein